MEKTKKHKSKLISITQNIQHPISETAITLVALVITIIVLLVLAGVTLNMVLGENGIFKKANIASEETAKSQAIEDIKMKVLEAQAKKDGKATLVDVVENLEQAADEYKVNKTSQIASLVEGSIAVNEAENIEEIYVINTKYNYEVKVDKMLQVSLMQKVGEQVNKKYTITFNANGGTIKNTSKQIAYNEEYGKLEVPEKIGYTFEGWYTRARGRNKNRKYYKI